MKKIYNLEEIFIGKNYAYAFNNTSFDAEKRGETFAAAAKATMKEMFGETIKLNPNKKEEIENQFDNIIDKYKNKIDDLAASKSKIYSLMITGPANFPVARNNKALNVEHNKSEKIREWLEKVEKNLIKKYSVEYTVKEKVEKEINEYYDFLNNHHYDGKINLKGRLLTIAKNGGAKEVKEAIADYKIFTKRNGIHKKLDEMIEAPKEENKKFVINDSVYIIDDVEAKRIKIYFSYKPDENVRGHLKSKGFKWSPKNKCWQNFRRADRLTDTTNYLKTL